MLECVHLDEFHVAYLTDCDFLKTPVLLVEVFISSCVVQCLGWIAKIV